MVRDSVCCNSIVTNIDFVFAASESLVFVTVLSRLVSVTSLYVLLFLLGVLLLCSRRILQLVKHILLLFLY